MIFQEKSATAETASNRKANQSADGKMSKTSADKKKGMDISKSQYPHEFNKNYLRIQAVQSSQRSSCSKYFKGTTTLLEFCLTKASSDV